MAITDPPEGDSYARNPRYVAGWRARQADEPRAGTDLWWLIGWDVANGFLKQAWADGRKAGRREAHTGGDPVPNPFPPGTAWAREFEAGRVAGGGTPPVEPTPTLKEDPDMAEQAKNAGNDEGRGTTAGHNVANLRDSMNRGFEEIYEIDRQIERARETYIKPLQDQKNEKKKELRDALGAKQRDLKPWYDLYKRKRDAEQMEEDDEGKQSLDTLRLGYEALREGEQLDYIFALSESAAHDAKDAA